MANIDINKIREKFLMRLFPSGWDKILEPYINGNEFKGAVNQLVERREQGHKFEPEFKNIFRAFEVCPYDDLKVILIGQDPYPQEGVADGISFSCSRKDKYEKSLQYIFKELYNKYEGMDKDLSRWSAQGVLMLNTALTVEVGKIGSHYDIWDPFTDYLLTVLNAHKNDRVAILMGKKAEKWEKHLSKQHILKCSHPASAAYSGGTWRSGNIFKHANHLLITQNENKIEW